MGKQVMKKHIVTLEELKPSISEAEVMLAQHSEARGLAKGLYWYPSYNHYKIWKNGEVVYTSMWLDYAITEYNKI